MIIVNACTVILVNACNVIIHVCTMIIRHAFNMILASACTLILVYACGRGICFLSYSAPGRRHWSPRGSGGQSLLGEQKGWGAARHPMSLNKFGWPAIESFAIKNAAVIARTRKTQHRPEH